MSDHARGVVHTSRGPRGLGAYPSLPDIRDKVLRFERPRAASSIDLWHTGHAPRIWNQDQLGSCTAFGTSRLLVFDLAKQGTISNPDNFLPSFLFQYYNSRLLENDTAEDAGATVADAIKALSKYGLAPDSDWTYDEAKFATKPPAKAYTDALLYEAVKYAKVTMTQDQMIACLEAGYPFAEGISVYSSFESAAVERNGVVPMPTTREQNLGGHCTATTGWLPGSELQAQLQAAGYPTTNVNTDWVYFIKDNSWDTSWGFAGRFFIPAQYLTNGNLASDAWVVQQASSPSPAPTPPTPTPTPTPTPGPADTPTASDRAFVAAFEPYADKHHTDKPLVAAIKAYHTWAAAKGLA